MRGRTRVLAVVAIAALMLAMTASAVQAVPWWPDECQDVNWNSPSQVWGCVSAVASALLGGWVGWEPGG